MVTLKEIAKICGCSIATVNRALYDRPDISETTKEKIKKVAEENGYRPHLIARSLVKGRTNIIGLTVLDIQNPFFGQLINFINKTLLKMDYSLHLGFIDGSPESEYQVLELMAGMKVDGIIHFPLNRGEEYKQYLKRLRIPLVHFCNYLDDNFPFVGVNEQQAIMEAVAFIRAHGYKELIYVSPPLRYRGSRNLYTIEERLRGFEQASQGVDIRIIDNKNYINPTYDYIRGSSKRICVLCSNDIYALEIMTDLRSRGMVPPRHYGIMGFDDISLLRHIAPRLTTIAYPIKDLAQNVIDMLFNHIKGGQAERIVLNANLIDGETV